MRIYCCVPMTVRLRHADDSAALPLITDERCRLTAA
jgi:hypothetical protein